MLMNPTPTAPTFPTTPDSTMTTSDIYVMGDDPEAVKQHATALEIEKAKKQADKLAADVDAKIKEGMDRYNNAMTDTLNEVMFGVPEKKKEVKE